MVVVPEEVKEAAMGLRYPGENTRVIHQYRRDGSVCSSDAAMSVMRSHDGWVFNCFRCGLSGFLPLEDRDPKATKESIEKKQIDRRPCWTVALPTDAVPMWGEWNNKAPVKAFTWLYKYGVGDDDIKQHRIHWSPLYNRVIIPVYKFLNTKDKIQAKLLGWVGRDVDWKKGDKGQKYLIKKINGTEFRFVIQGSTDKVLVVEDVLSAIRVHNATGYTAVALLGHGITTTLLNQFRRADTLFIWLDRDVLTKAINYADKARQIGVPAILVNSELDPKLYSADEIRTLISFKKGV